MSQLKRYRVQVFGASIHPVSEQKEFAQSLHANFPLLADPSKATAKAYGVYISGLDTIERWAFLIDRRGVVRAIDHHVNPMEHGQDVLKLLSEQRIPRR